jgi:hypothetical protein
MYKETIKYQEIQNNLKSSLLNFIQQAEQALCPLVIIESLGTLQMINRILSNYNLYTIWIDFGRSLPYDDLFTEQNPNAQELNQEMEELYQKNELNINNEFNMKTNTFKKAIPEIIKPLIEKDSQIYTHNQLIMNNSQKLDKLLISNKSQNSHKHILICDHHLTCVGCGAAFSKEEYLQRHYQRFPHCKNIIELSQKSDHKSSR